MSRILIGLIVFAVIIIVNGCISSALKSHGKEISEPVLDETETEELKIGVEIVSGNNQKGIVSSCAEIPVVIRACNLNNSIQSLEGIPLEFGVITGGGKFVADGEEETYSTTTNAKGKGTLHYHYSQFPGTSHIRVGVSNDSSVKPVELQFEAYLPKIEIVEPLNVPKKRFPDGVERYVLNSPIDGLGDAIKVKVTDPQKRTPLKGIEVRWEIVEDAIFLPEIEVTNDAGEAIFGFCGVGLPRNLKQVNLKAYLPDFMTIDSQEPLSDKIEIGVLEGNQDFLVAGGQAQIGVANRRLSNPLKVYVSKKEKKGNIIPTQVMFKIIRGEGTIIGINPQMTVDGYAAVEYMFGHKTEVQIIEASSELGKVYFVAAPPQIKFVRKDSNGQFVREELIFYGDPTNWSNETAFYVEMEAPLYTLLPKTVKLQTTNLCGEEIQEFVGAAAAISQDIKLTLAVNQPAPSRYLLLRSVSIVATSERVAYKVKFVPSISDEQDPGERIAPEEPTPAPIARGLKYSSTGSLVVHQGINQGGISIKGDFSVEQMFEWFKNEYGRDWTSKEMDKLVMFAERYKKENGREPTIEEKQEFLKKLVVGSDDSQKK